LCYIIKHPRQQFHSCNSQNLLQDLLLVLFFVVVVFVVGHFVVVIDAVVDLM
jgi:hypothetical protein